MEEFKHNIDCTSNLKFREKVELVDRAEVEKYVEHDREVITNKSLNELTKLLTLQGLQMPPTLAVNKESGKAYFHDVNHRMGIFKRLNIKWVPISIKYDIYIYNNEDD